MEKLLEKFFGVGEIKIYWNYGDINAMTVAGSSMVIASRNNKGDFSRAKFIIVMYENLVYHAGLDEKELMGILLHEIGHCFYTSPLLICGEVLGVVINPISLVMAFIGKPLYDLTGKLNDLTKEKLPFIHNLQEKWENFTTEINGILRYIPSLPNPQGIFYHLTNNLTNPFKAIGNYGGERGADSFATKYGYGEYLITGLKKINKPEYLTGTQMVGSIGPLGDFLVDYNELINNLVGMICLEPHPSNDMRAQSMIRKLERDLQKGDYPPEVEKDLKNEINRMKKYTLPYTIIRAMSKLRKHGII